MHVKGFTKLNPHMPEPIRGTYSGLASRAAIEHLQELGVTAVELMPVHSRVDDRHLVSHGLCNYWGYNTLSFFALETRYASASDPDGVINEFKRMVKQLHEAGIEVILDVVYNHTAEGGVAGPTLSFKGIDNKAYYRHDEDDNYVDVTGCGNTFAASNPQNVRFIVDSLRWWI